MKMKKITVAVLFSAAISIISGCSLVGIGVATDTIGEMGVTVDRPASWKKTKMQKDEKYVDYVIDIPQKKSNASNVDGHVALSLARPVGQEKLTVDSELKGLIKYLNKHVTELKTLEERDMTFMGQSGKRLILQFRNAEDKSISEKLAVTFTIKDKNAYTIILDEDMEDFALFMPQYEAMVASMKFSEI